MYRVELSQHLQRHLLDQRLNTAPQKLRLLQLPLATENINKGNFLALFSTRHSKILSIHGPAGFRSHLMVNLLK